MKSVNLSHLNEISKLDASPFPSQCRLPHG
uniref:Uncharacterized protein n=1 Tax=Arundo donax TaxID=35708 RepID=A0A0A9AGZ3_ARUDO